VVPSLAPPVTPPGEPPLRGESVALELGALEAMLRPAATGPGTAERPP
jgi:hypothetical protein